MWEIEKGEGGEGMRGWGFSILAFSETMKEHIAKMLKNGGLNCSEWRGQFDVAD